jgi:hypothetical protein
MDANTPGAGAPSPRIDSMSNVAAYFLSDVSSRPSPLNAGASPNRLKSFTANSSALLTARSRGTIWALPTSMGSPSPLEYRRANLQVIIKLAVPLIGFRILTLTVFVGRSKDSHFSFLHGCISNSAIETPRFVDSRCNRSRSLSVTRIRSISDRVTPDMGGRPNFSSWPYHYTSYVATIVNWIVPFPSNPCGASGV